MFHTLTAAAMIALAATGCQNELELFPHAAAQTGPTVPVRTPAATEDDRAYDCIFDGNRICGPTNPQGVPAGCYNDRGALVAPWPCHVVIDANGNADVYGGAR